jgi:hypothetical protein
MIVAGSASPLLLASAGGYNLTRSLRFRSSASAYLNRTPSASNRKTWTWSGWVKRSTIGANNILFAARTAVGGTYFVIYFNASNDLRIESNLETAYPLYKTNALFRDPSAWYHIVVALDMTQATSTERLKVYVNGVLQTTANYNVPAQNTDLAVNSTETHLIGQQASDSYLDGYLTEVNFIDGQALTPSSFGETSATTGVWQPVKYAGTYGTNGFYLPFTDNSALTTSSNVGLGKDFSGNGNYWTTNNISLTAGVTYDSMTDVPTLTSATAANYCVWNPTVPVGGTFTNANLAVSRSSGSTETVPSTMAFGSSGKYYVEFSPATVSGNYPGIGFADITRTFNASDNPHNYGGASYLAGGSIQIGGTTYSGFSSFTNNDIIGLAIDTSNGKFWFSKNGTFQNGDPTTGTTTVGTIANTASLCPAVGTYNAVGAITLNCGQRPFAYTPPTGFLRLNTFNLPTPTIGATASTQANKNFDATLWTGNGGVQTITPAGAFQTDLVWIKSRSGTNTAFITDVVRGATKTIYPSNTGAEFTETTGLTAFTSSGYTLGADTSVNGSGSSYVGWAWKANGTGVSNTAGSITSTVSANTSAGFSVVTYTGTGANATVGHGLGVAPKMVIIKQRNGTGSWVVWQASYSPSFRLDMETTNALFGPFSSFMQDTVPSSTVVSLGTNGNYNGSGSTYVMYCFSEVAGYSKFASYTGNGSADGPFVYTGFKPRFVMWKNASAGPSNWMMMDTARNTYNVTNTQLNPNNSDAESSASAIDCDYLSNGFKIKGNSNNFNGSGDTIIYAAFAESPFKYSLGR